MTQRIDLDAIAKREREATPGPWIMRQLTEAIHIGTPKPWDDKDIYTDVAVVEGGEIHAEEYYHRKLACAEFIAHAREDIPALLRIAEKAKALVEKLDAAIESGLDMGHWIRFPDEIVADLTETSAELRRALGDET